MKVHGSGHGTCHVNIHDHAMPHNMLHATAFCNGTAMARHEDALP